MAGFPVVGIGSSAGGLEALQQLFRAMPPDSGLAFIVAAHLDPSQKSHLPELLSRCTEMPVVQIESSVAVEPDHVYVIAPDQELTIRNGVVHGDKPTAPRGHRHPVDAFFRSLAEDQGERAIAIVLSGTGTNGSLGLRFIKAEGGITLAQEPETAGFTGMPRSAIATGIVDLVLPPDRMPEALLGIVRHPYIRQPAKIDEAAPEDQLQTLLALVRSNTRQDFGSYRKRTLLRRIQRRMGLHRIETLAQYIERLRNDAQEARALAADLTINVTGFFRDPEAWQVLGDRVIAPLLQQRTANSTIRVWVPGCSTGEEAYSIAMLVAEQAAAAAKSVDLKLFATDVAAGVLTSARGGIYPGSIAQDVSAERLERWFEKEDDTYCVRPALRETITFAPQNLLQDPPFSRIDLISCRNLLIYLEPDIQKRVINLFHFALREGGHLFLGPSEAIGSEEELFRSVSKKWRIFRRLGPTRHDIVDFPLIGPNDGAPVGELAAAAAADPPARVGELMDQALLERYAPASALIDIHHRVLFLRGPTEDYLRPPAGEPSYDLLAMAREGLQTVLRMTIRKAIDEGREATAHARVRRGDALHPVRIVVAPLRGPRDAALRLLVGFFERGAESEEAAAASEVEEAPSEGQLQSELDTTREDLRLSVEQMEAANEELKASNEEIRSINEELQASNEELETSKEELQSLNEELNTVNNQLQAKVGELEGRTDDLNNLLKSTDIATLFLDRSLCIRWFAPSMSALLELLPTDLGRPISHFAQRFSGGDLLEEARKVLERLVPSDAEVVDDLGRWYIRHIVPYRTAADRIEGVVVTFTEISDRKRREREVEEAKEFAEAIVEAVRFPLLVLTPELRVEAANAAFYEIFQVSPDETEGRPLAQLGNRQWDIPELLERLNKVLPDQEEFADFEVEHDFERIGPRTMFLHARRLDGAQLILLGMVDLTERQRHERERELLMRELSHRVKNVLAVVQALANQTDHSESVEEFRETFVGRLTALARAHSLLLDAEWRGADLRQLVEKAVEAYRVDHPDVIEIDGEPVSLSPNHGVGLSLILHELGTNAAKYGALSQHEGRVRVAWQMEGAGQERRLRFVWQEHDGPPVEPPTGKGFGTRLIERAAGYELQGEVELDYARDGLRCELNFPVT
jgi:two-component system, chemotaxis family, CheB/CheR fusion protein